MPKNNSTESKHNNLNDCSHSDYFFHVTNVRISGTSATITMNTNESKKINTELQAAGGNSSFSVILIVFAIRFFQTGSINLLKDVTRSNSL